MATTSSDYNDIPSYARSKGSSLDREKLEAEQLRSRADHEKRRAHEERISAQEVRRLAEYDKLMAEEDLRRAKENRRKAEQERRLAEEDTKRAMHRKELALRDRAGMEEETRLAEDDRRREMEYARRYEVDRLRADQERRRLEEELRRAEERLRMEEERLRMERELLSRREPYYAQPPMMETRAPIPPPREEPEIMRAIQAPTTQVATAVVQEPHVDTEEKMRRKAEKRARRAEDDRLRAEKLRKKEEKRRLRAEEEKKRLEDYLTATQSVLTGVLSINVVEAKDLPKWADKVYAEISLENQKVTTKVIKKAHEPQWRTEYKLYHSDPDAKLHVNLYHKSRIRFRGDHFIGRVTVPVKDLTDGKDDDAWYPLHHKIKDEKKHKRKEKAKREKERYKGWIPEEVKAWHGYEHLGEIHLRMLYRQDPLSYTSTIESKNI